MELRFKVTPDLLIIVVKFVKVDLFVSILPTIHDVCLAFVHS